MKREIITKLHSSFEMAVQQKYDMEFWFARDLQELLDYSKWKNFIKVIDKAKTACANANRRHSTNLLTSTKWLMWVKVQSEKLKKK